MNTHTATPWYRQFWPWFLMLFPFAAVVGGAATIWLAVVSDDGLVADDYYKQGLAINQTLARDRAAAVAGLHASLAVEQGIASLELHGRVTPPAELRLRILHPTRAGMDRAVILQHAGGGRYRGACTVPGPGRWHVLLEDPEGTWRLLGELEGGSGVRATLGTQAQG